MESVPNWDRIQCLYFYLLLCVFVMQAYIKGYIIQKGIENKKREREGKEPGTAYIVCGPFQKEKIFFFLLCAKSQF